MSFIVFFAVSLQTLVIFKMYAVWKCKHLVGVCTYVKYFENADLDNDVLLFTSIWKSIENKILKSLYLCVCMYVYVYI